MPNHLLVPLIVASALLLQQIDSTALATSLPAIGVALGETPVRAHLVLTSYLFSLAAFVPISGWIADRFGARLIFRIAIAIFTLASVVCGLTDSLEAMVLARVCQGVGGAMMVPVGRLILLRSVERREIVGALALMSMPAMVGPILGPLIGGFLTSFASWRWIFWVNLPVGVLGIVLTTIFIPDVREDVKRRFDPIGVTLLGFGLSALLFGIDTAATNSVSERFALTSIVLGAVAILLYVRHARLRDEPVLDLGLLRIETFRTSVLAGSLFRLAAGAIPFLLPLLFQEKFGYSPFESGAITFVSAVGALGIRTLSSRILRRFGFRAVLIWDAFIAAGFMAASALFRPEVPNLIILLTLFFAGVFRSLELVGINALTFADLTSPQMSHGTTLSTMAQRLSQSMAVAISAFILHISTSAAGLSFAAFDTAFVTIGVLAAVSGLLFTRLPASAGEELSGHRASPTSAPRGQ